VRVGICLLTLVPGEMGGSETYARGLLRALAQVGEHEYVVLVPEDAHHAAGGLPTAVAAGYRLPRGRLGRAIARARAAAFPAPLRSRLGDVDAIHYPFTVPLPRAPRPWATTLHDVLHLDLPEQFPHALRALRALTYDRAARSADMVIVVSAFVRERAVERLGLEAEKVRVIPLGVDHQRFRPRGEEREPFLLYPARPWRHKNHARLFEAFALLRRTHPDLRLVLTGGGHEDTLVPDEVDVRGLVSSEELASLYSRAACLVFPSLYEGFGLPPLEAMACGCPVAASRVGGLPETCGDAAVLFDPWDPEAIAAGVEEALDRAPDLRVRGLARAAAFTWEETARRHEAAYRDLTGGCEQTANNRARTSRAS
jgi:glycosyltransferase involved in cell wall biosynthesis